MSGRVSYKQVLFYCDHAQGVHTAYHDREYGFPLRSERAVLERLSLEIMQAGLSWELILRKRAALRRAFANFQPAAVAAFGARDIRRLLGDTAIIRNRLKIAAIIRNARAILALREVGGVLRWLNSQPSMALPQWVKILRGHFAFIGPEVAKEFLISTGYLPGAHRPSCPAYAATLARRPRWCQQTKGQR